MGAERQDKVQRSWTWREDDELFLAGGAKAFQNRRVSSAAPLTTVSPSGLQAAARSLPQPRYSSG